MTTLNVHGKARGEFHLIVKRATGEIENFKFPNLLLDNAFAASSRIIANCTVGSGATPPAGTDTQLVSRLGSNVSGDANTTELSTVFNGSIATVARKSVMTFAAGGVIGNVSELALYIATSIIPANIVVRSLITDVNGDPTTIPMGAGDQLTVEHTLYVDIETRPTPQVMNINGVDHTVSVVIGWPEFYASASRTEFAANNMPGLRTSAGTARAAESVTVGAVGSKVRPAYSGATFAAPLAIVDNVTTPAMGKKTCTASFTIPTSTQLTGDVPIAGVVMGSSASALTIAILFDPALPKNNTVGYTFALTATLERA